ncbi:hypothetical protein KAFR_0D02615 [Kazachstania africana CBS 2517]|uniref:Metallothionein n=1 Tax=Kazachstania africana (strain ATCC 22294 / BCRC 22015 / CBS 2517 / CECT 1963 / NBRC 1671 / NRRL Y-8276) TaxID=1071382 RepID=H2AU59_KAZAF|nr:hypothetical protein KAFR_0D02615 [Kazachstania africana CBS 2517]CCF57909.1 hypothetical protein KAFR_0D02615 [Kazachstania africana CBS 2517]
MANNCKCSNCQKGCSCGPQCGSSCTSNKSTSCKCSQKVCQGCEPNQCICGNDTCADACSKDNKCQCPSH